MHAIGDRAIRQGLDAIADAVRANGPRDRRPHIARLQLFPPDDVPRFHELGVVANSQPLWAYADSCIRTLTEPRLGPERSQWLYPFGALQRAGTVLAGGSDWWVSSVNPLHGVQVAVSRRALDAPPDAPSWLPEQRLDLPSILAAYTNGGTFVSFEDKDSGSLEIGKLAGSDRPGSEPARDFGGGNTQGARPVDAAGRTGGVPGRRVQALDQGSGIGMG